MDKETKDVIKPIMECLISLTEKQALLIQLLTLKLPGLSEDEKRKLLDSAQVNEQNVKIWRQSLQNFV